MIWFLTIPLEIPSQNSLKARHWQALARATKQRRAAWRWAGIQAMQAAGCPVATGPRSVHIIAYRRQRCRDIANLVGGAKACIDGLVDAGLLIDDRDAMATISYAQDVLSAKPGRCPCAVLTVSDLIQDPPHV